MKVRPLCLAIVLGLFTNVPANVHAQEEDAAEAQLERIEVTGSRIKRTDVEAALPVTVIDREQIELSGQTSVSDLLRNTTFNSFGSYRPQSGSSDQATAQISLRGLGSGRTLVLIDGRRASKGGNTTGVVNDLNLIPLAAVDRIEILSDGASALYGSDAIGGVINVITRRDFEGAEFRIGAGRPRMAGGDTDEMSVVFGASGERGRVIAGAAYNFRDIVFQRERPYWQSNSGDGTRFSTTTNYSPFGNTYQRLDSGLWVAGECDLPAFRVFQNDFFPGGGEICAYDFSLIAANEASAKNTSVFSNAEYQINDDWNLYSRFSASRNESFGRYAPAPVALVLPPNTANNPLDVTAVLYHRFAALGPRDNTIEGNAYDWLVGAQGQLGAFDLDFGARLSINSSINLGRNYVVNPIARQYLIDGTYNAADPFNNPPSVLSSMKATISRESTFRQEELFVSAAGDLWELGGGTAGYVFGMEYRKEVYADDYDSLSEAGVIGGSAGNSAGGGRNVRSAFAEVLLPLTDNLELDIAGRQDRYSDYGSDFSPKVALRWQPLEQLVLRASFGEGFLAPNLQQLTAQESTSAPTVLDLTGCAQLGLNPCPAIQQTERRRSNPDLVSETSKQWSLGLAWQPLDWFDTTLDYYAISIDNRIAFYGAQTLLNREFQGQPIPPGLGVVRNSAGAIVEILTGFGNEGRVETSGLDLNARARFGLADWGSLSHQLQVSYVLDYVIDGGPDLVGSNSAPAWRATLNNDWQFSDYTLAWNISAIDRNASGDGTFALPTHVVHDLQLRWAAPWNGSLVVGVRNLGNKQPPIDLADPSGRQFNFNLYDGYGRVPYVRYEQRF